MGGIDLKAGDTASRSLTLTAEHVETYARLSGDRNPLHFDTFRPEVTPETE